MDEFALIARYFAPLADAGADVVVGIGDDGAVVAHRGGELVVVVDTLVEGVHFPAGLAPAAIGHRAAAVNLSDIAAMGAVPRWATLALTLPQADPVWLAAFSQGLGAALASADVALVGGDTTRGPLTVTVQIIGVLEQPALTRGGAQAGDLIAVSGTLGDAAAGLALWATPPGDADRDWLVQRFCHPTPRLALGRALAVCAHAAIDVSDGLLADIGHILEASGCAGEIDLPALPLSAALRRHCGSEQALHHALGGGDDYELAFTLPPAALPALSAAADRAAFTVIGRVVAGSGLRCLDAEGRVMPRDMATGYRHFS